MDNLWINKYKSTKLCDIIGHKIPIESITNWLTNIDQYKSQSIIVSGVHGIGKSLTIKLLLTELNYLIRIIYPNEIKIIEYLMILMIIIIIQILYILN